MAGRKKYAASERDRGRVEAMAAYGAPELAIAKVIGIDAKTLRKYFRDELDSAHIRANSMVAGSLYAAATAKPGTPGQVAAAIFWCKTRLGWRETNNIEVAGSGGGPLEMAFTFALDNASSSDDKDD